MFVSGYSLLMLTVLVAGMTATPLERKDPEAEQRSVAWAGMGRHRILVRVDPLKLEGRDADESIAMLEVDSTTWPVGIAGDRVDLSSLQVIKYSPETGNPEPYDANLYQHSKYDRPFRFYDQALQDEFTAYEGYISEDFKAGRPLTRVAMKFGHRFFNPAAIAKNGKLVWNHTQFGELPSYYAIYFDLLPEGKEGISPPAGFIGDGGNRIVRDSSVSAPIGNVRGTAVDWNGDGLADLLYGTASGNLVVLQNTGSLARPEFNIRRLLYDIDGQPIDVGFDANPHVTDWNGDGKKDVLVGAEKGCILYFENVGTNDNPLLKFNGFVLAGDNILRTPNWPIAELQGHQPGTVFREDYMATPFAVDWDADGDSDLLAGGFVTGRVFLFENVGKRKDGTPLLKARGPLEADGKPLDTTWAASPVAVDLDNDGDLDLVCGGKAQKPKGGDMSDAEGVLFYYQNEGTRSQPILSQKPFPKNGTLSTGVTVMASLLDFDGDKLLDLFLVVHSTRETLILKNIGSHDKPLFDVRSVPVRGYWNAEALPGGSRMVDWNRDGSLDIISGFHVLLNTERRFPGAFARSIDLTEGRRIQHEVPHGDENPGIVLYDFDQDGDHDCIYGAHSGHVWFHENRGNDVRPDWDRTGYRMLLSNNQPIKVGLPEGTKPAVFDFTVLQGARAKPALGDFNGDGLTDLMVGDTFGKVRYFENVGSNKQPKFAPPEMVFEAPNRANLAAGDWNSDGRHDVLVILGSKIWLLENQGITNQSKFKSARDMNLPESPGNFSSAMMADFNRDGDMDLVYNTSHRMTCWIEGSFQKAGYLKAHLISVDTK